MTDPPPDDAARTFLVGGSDYDSFMGRYSGPLAALFADAAGVRAGQDALDVGCGPGALTGVLVARLGAASVGACDPSDTFVEECAERCPGVTVRAGRAEAIPFDRARFDRVLAQLVMHFVADPDRAMREFARVLRPGGIAAACVWDFSEGREMLRSFWDAATALDPAAPDEARRLRFGRSGELSELFERGGFQDVRETTLQVSSTYTGFEELWAGFLRGIGPAGSYCVGLGAPARGRLRGALFDRLGSPDGPFTLGAVARCATGRAPR